MDWGFKKITLLFAREIHIRFPEGWQRPCPSSWWMCSHDWFPRKVQPHIHDFGASIDGQSFLGSFEYKKQSHNTKALPWTQLKWLMKIVKNSAKRSRTWFPRSGMFPSERFCRCGHNLLSPQYETGHWVGKSNSQIKMREPSLVKVWLLSNENTSNNLRLLCS